MLKSVSALSLAHRPPPPFSCPVPPPLQIPPPPSPFPQTFSSPTPTHPSALGLDITRSEKCSQRRDKYVRMNNKGSGVRLVEV